LSAEYPQFGSWINTRIADDGEMTLGCDACSYVRNKTQFAEFIVKMTSMNLQKENLKKHRSNDNHKQAVTHFLCSDSFQNRVGINVAPPASFFEELISNIEKGQAVCGSSKKLWQGAWCLNEAVKSIDRNLLANAEAISLFRDERKSRLAMRFRAVKHNLEVRSGTLGQQREFGTGAANITTATSNIIERMCSSLHGCRFTPKKVKSKINKKLLQHIRRKTVMITVDAAADEVLSAEMLPSRELRGGTSTILPNIKFVLRDKTHASRRPTTILLVG